MLPAVQRRCCSTTGAGTSSSCTPSISGPSPWSSPCSGVGDRARRPVVKAFGVIAILFLLVSLGGHTPFYRLWYAVMPMMDKVRAPGMAFMLVALPVAVFAGFGADRLLRRDLSPRALLDSARRARRGWRCWAWPACSRASPWPSLHRSRPPAWSSNAGPLRAGALRLLAVVVLGGARALGRAEGQAPGRCRRRGALAVVVVADLWSVDRLFFEYREPAAVLFADDAITSTHPRGSESIPGAGRRRLSGVVPDGAPDHDHAGVPRLRDPVLRRAAGRQESVAQRGKPEPARPAGGTLPAAAPDAGGAGISPRPGAGDDHARVGRRAARA